MAHHSLDVTGCTARMYASDVTWGHRPPGRSQIPRGWLTWGEVHQWGPAHQVVRFVPNVTSTAGCTIALLSPPDQNSYGMPVIPFSLGGQSLSRR
ncbi:hypothetical protein HYDPIDRAFT_111271 [Hydnomerulius pinastri MD-312]|uniref:Uncharacterized protein n=1 Tax=Hydnomerulius pinastri MD-312 TaxID=994086 RepID=A0A0C9WG28_9AGAM|nr:hypothetical protein HYDPIDRAFT_111271 [Hydnomerulius pinastri MD-312]